MIEVNDISRVEVMNNFVLIKPKSDTYIIKSGDRGFYINTHYDREKHAATEGEVISFPKSTYYNRDDKLYSMPWNTEMEIQAGDSVFFYYLAYMNALDHDRAFVYNKELYVFINYEYIYVKKNKSGITPLNGQLIVSPYINDGKYDFIKKHNLAIGKVEFVGSKNKGYIDQYQDVEDIDNIQEGDLIVFDVACDIPLQHNLHNSLKGDNDYFRMERRLVYGKLQ